MTEFNELLTKLQSLEIIQKRGGWEDNIPYEIWEEYFEKNYTVIKNGLLVDTRRWYETSVTVIKIFDKYLGIRYITNMFSEGQDWEDCFVQIKFYEMVEQQTVTYVYRQSAK